MVKIAQLILKHRPTAHSTLEMVTLSYSLTMSISLAWPSRRFTCSYKSTL